jgi:hypothetical protein
VRVPVPAFLFFFIALLTTSCFVKTNRVHFQYTAALPSQHFDFNKDSLRFEFSVTPDKKNIVIPFLISKGNKEKANISYGLHGKGISGREYTITYEDLVIKRDCTVIGKSKDKDLFKEQVQRPVPADAVSPLYGTGYILPLHDPQKANLNLHLVFTVQSKLGVKEEHTLDVPLKRIPEKSVTLFNPLK